MGEAKAMSGIKITLTTKKEVLFREYKIRHREMAIRAVGNRAGDSQFLFGELLQKEMVKVLLVNIDGKPISATQIEDLDALFSPAEYNELAQVIGKVMGGNSQMGEAKIEFVNSGA